MSMNTGNRNVPMGGPSLGPGAGGLASLIQLKNDLGIQATTITGSEREGYRIDWNGEVEDFSQFEDAAAALRAAAN